jgi:hypothetical protein
MVTLVLTQDMEVRMLMKQNQVLPCLYMSWISAQTNCGFKGLAIKGGYCQGFTKSHSGSGPNGL